MILDTAFLTNVSRAKRKDISKDSYATDWIISEMRDEMYELWDQYSKNVCAFDDIELSVRNRHYTVCSSISI